MIKLSRNFSLLRYPLNQSTCIRKYTTKNNDSNPNDVKSKENDPDGGYMKRRLQQLAEDATPSAVDPNAGMIEDALPYNKIELHQKLDKIENDPSNFEYKYQQAIGISKLPKGASKHTKDIAMAKPWSGTESHYDASLRMLNDSIKPMKVKRKTNSVSNTIITPPTPVRDRIHDAREGALDYKLAKISDKDAKNKNKNKNDDDGWSEMYKERLLGPSMLLNDSFASVDNSIKSLADQKIMEAQRRGDFKNIKRGKPLEKGYGATENMFIDRTEYHLNQILKSQDALPPWIEKQGGCDFRILRFRQALDKEWLKWTMTHMKDKFPTLSDDELIRKMEMYSKNEFSDDPSMEKLRSQDWLESRNAYFDSQLRHLNDTIRGYNLQAPLASQKLYLLKEKELDSCYKRVAPLLVNAFKKHLKGETENEKRNKDVDPDRVHTYGNLPQRENIYQQESEPLSSMFKKLFW